jgi:hypothetical protein
MAQHFFSATCYYFGRELYEKMRGSVPIGLVESAWGGTIVESWMSPNGLKKCDSFPIATPSDRFGIGPNDPSALFNGSVSPYLPMRLKAVVWYQVNHHSFQWTIVVTSNEDDGDQRFPSMTDGACVVFVL